MTKTTSTKRLLPRVAGFVFAACGLFGGVGAGHAQGAFYRAIEAEIAGGPPGSIIREEPMRNSPPGGVAHRVLYRSTSPEGKPIAVSGVIIIPPGNAPAGGWPVVAWAHPTTGIVPRCAPSLARFIFQQIAGNRPLTEQGFAIAATDYSGLGTAGPHPYLVGVSEARAVIDSVRAARTFPGVSDNRYAVWGHSQGGQAALFTGMISKDYAPELELLGVAAAAPATDLATLMTDDLNSTGGRNLTAMTVWAWSRVYDAPADTVVTPAAMPVVDRLAEECIESPFDIWARARTAAPLAQQFLIVKNPAEIEPWHALLVRNTSGLLPRTLPVFLAQGTKDGLVRPQVTMDYMKRLCGGGSKVRMLVLPGVSHGLAGAKSADAAVAWIADRFAGRPAPSDCGG
jgi:acetyl esterase/lipase